MAVTQTKAGRGDLGAFRTDRTARAAASRVITFEHGPRLRVLGVGGHLPDRILANAELEGIVGTTDEWIRTRTGIRERRIAGPLESAATLGAEAARRALENAGLPAEEIDVVLVATATPDGAFPSVAAQIQDKIGAAHASALDLGAACSGFVYGLSVAQGMLASGQAGRLLLVGTEVLSRLVDWEDRSTCVLFGDGAGAVALGAPAEPAEAGHTRGAVDGYGGGGADHGASGRSAPETPAAGMLALELGSDGSGGELLRVEDGKIRMAGREVFRFAVEQVPASVRNVVEGAELTLEDVDWFVLHQANVRIIQAVAERLRVPMERFLVSADRLGNTSAASIPLSVDPACRSGRIKENDLVVLSGFGGGLTWASALLRW